MLQKSNVFILLAIIAILVSVIIYREKRYDDRLQQLNNTYDSILIEKESIIDSLYQEIGSKKSVIDSLFSVRNKVVEKTVIIKEQILTLPLDSSVSLLRENLKNYDEKN